jgi:hypothetical protein
MISNDDWRLTGQERYLTGATLYLRRWSSNDPTWDHDHCEFCLAEFSDSYPDCLTEGYTTADLYRWICPDCFNDFKVRFDWAVDVR